MTHPNTPDVQGNQPGDLRGQAVIEIQTRQAQRLVYGRLGKDNKPPIIGLVKFGVMMRQAWLAATLDDPWADWCLLRTLEALETGRAELQDMLEQTESALKQIRGVQIQVAQSNAPVRFPLNFSNPYGYMGAYLLADYDNCARALLTARHVGVMDRDESERKLNLGGRAVRRAFSTPQWFRYTSVRRDDVPANHPRLQKARELMGEIPQEVLDGTLRARIAPEVRKRAIGQSRQESSLFSGRRASIGTTTPSRGVNEDTGAPDICAEDEELRQQI